MALRSPPFFSDHVPPLDFSRSFWRVSSFSPRFLFLQDEQDCLPFPPPSLLSPSFDNHGDPWRPSAGRTSHPSSPATFGSSPSSGKFASITSLCYPPTCPSTFSDLALVNRKLASLDNSPLVLFDGGPSLDYSRLPPVQFPPTVVRADRGATPLRCSGCNGKTPARTCLMRRFRSLV